METISFKKSFLIVLKIIDMMNLSFRDLYQLYKFELVKDIEDFLAGAKISF